MSRLKGVAVQMSELLAEYKDEIDDSIEINSTKIARKTAKKLRQTSPRKSGDYARGWRSKTLKNKDAVVYNATAPGLTHLLENGHNVVNAKGQVGRANGIKHILPAAEEAIEEYLEAIERDLQM